MASKKMLIPDINAYSQFRPFLDDFLRLNKEANKNFSFRYLATKLGWSASHLNDVIQGRRHLSPAKIMELIEFLGLKNVRAERLLLLALFESNSIGEKAKDFLALRNSSTTVQTMTPDEAKMMTSTRLQQVLHYIGSRDGKWDVDDFIKRSRGSKNISRSELSEIIKRLETAGIIRWDEAESRYIAEKTEFYEDTPNVNDTYLAAQRAYAKSYEEFLDDRFPSWTDFFGAVNIPRARLPEVFERLAGLRNYLYEIRGEELAKDPKTQFEVFQFSISLFSIFRRD